MGLQIAHVYLIPLSCAGTGHEKPTCSSSLFKHKTNSVGFQFHFDFIFPPPSKSFILLQGPINPIHIHYAFVAPWKMDFHVPQWTWTVCSPFVFIPLLPLDLCVKSGVIYGSHLIRLILFGNSWIIFLVKYCADCHCHVIQQLFCVLHVCPAVRSPIASIVNERL